jgi:type II secretory pathway component PulK
MVLLVVALLTAVIVDFSFNTRLDSRIAANVRDSLIAASLARSGYEMALTILMEDANAPAASAVGESSDPVSALLDRARRQASTGGASAGSPGNIDSVDSLQEAWARMDLLQIPLEEDQDLKVQVEDLGGKINLNAIIIRGQDGAAVLNRPVFEQLTTLLDQALAGLERGNGQDPEELSGEEIGAFEDQVYNSLSDAYSSKNGPFDSVAELQLVEGVDDALFAVIRDALTVYPFSGGGGININTAPARVLKSIRVRENRAIDSPEPLSEESVTRLLEARNGGIAIRSKSELRDLLGLDAAAIFTPEIAYGSSYFSVEAVGKVKETMRRIRSAVNRGESGPVVLYWRVE